jgi:hypothetical protein
VHDADRLHPTLSNVSLRHIVPSFCTTSLTPPRRNMSHKTETPRGNTKNYAYTTLITRSSYLAGVIILAYTLRKQNSQYPLVVLYTDALTADSVAALQHESKKLNLILKKTEALVPRENVKVTLIAERFGDTW